MRVTYDCAQCGRTVTKIRSPKNMAVAPRYCSQACHGAARRGIGEGRRVTHTVACETCGTAFNAYRAPSAPVPRFCSTECAGRGQQGAHNPSFTGGRHIGRNGYVLVLTPAHPNADSRGYVYEHRLVAERSVGRPLRPGEVVHHINQIKTDNRPENLQVLASQSEHVRIHQELRNAS